MACKALGLDVHQPKPFPQRGLVLRPHQVTGIYSALLREKDALPFHIFADDCGLGKTCQLLHLVYFRNKVMMRKEASDYKVTLILAPKSTCSSWLRDASFMFPTGPEGLQVWTYYSRGFDETTRNYREISELVAAVKKLRCDDPVTGRTVILSTYDTFIKYAFTVNKARQKERHDKEEIPTSYRPNNFAPGDFDLVWDISIERVIIDEGHRAKNPKTKLNTTLCRLICNNFWFVSATPIYNSIEDILGITKLLKIYLEAGDFGVLDEIEPFRIQEEAKSKGKVKPPKFRPQLEVYQNANIAWKDNVKCWKTSRTFLKSKVPNNIKPWYNSKGQTTAQLYGLHLLHYDMVVGVLEAHLDKGRIAPSVAKEVVGLILRMLMIRRTKTSMQLINDKDGGRRCVSPGDGMMPCVIKTVDLAPGFAEYEFYQNTLAPLHSERINKCIVKDLLEGQDDHVFNGAFERLSVAGTAHQYLRRIS